jgi:hypothetical protein
MTLIMKKTLLFGLALVLLASCGKDKFQTKPQITITSVSTDIVPAPSTQNPQPGVRIVLEFTDQEGDVSDSVIMVRQRLNRSGLGLANAVRQLKYKIPTFPNTQSGEINVDLDYNGDLTLGMTPLGPAGSRERDTLALKFVVLDLAGNKSDTATANVIVIR